MPMSRLMHRNQLVFYFIASSALASNGTVRIERLAVLMTIMHGEPFAQGGRSIWYGGRTIPRRPLCAC